MTTVYCTLNGVKKKFTVSLDDHEAAAEHIRQTIPGVEITGTDFTVAPSPTAKPLAGVAGFLPNGSPEPVKKNG